MGWFWDWEDFLLKYMGFSEIIVKFVGVAAADLRW